MSDEFIRTRRNPEATQKFLRSSAESEHSTTTGNLVSINRIKLIRIKAKLIEIEKEMQRGKLLSNKKITC